MPRGSLLAEHDVLAIGSEVKGPTEVRRPDGPRLQGDTPSHVEADQADDRWICLVDSCKPELVRAGPTDCADVGGEPGQRDGLAAGKGMKHRRGFPVDHHTGCGPLVIW